MGRLLDIVSALLCVGAGLYLLQYNSGGGATGTSWFQIIGHGMGIYFIGKGIFVLRSGLLANAQLDRMDQLVELGYRRDSADHRSASEPAPAD